MDDGKVHGLVQAVVFYLSSKNLVRRVLEMLLEKTMNEIGNLDSSAKRRPKLKVNLLEGLAGGNTPANPGTCL